MPPKKRYNSRFPPVRIKKIMQSDEEIGKVAAAVPVLISRAIEMFMVRLLRDAEQQIVQRNARTLTPQHIKQAINSHQCMGFLQSLVADIPDNFQNPSAGDDNNGVFDSGDGGGDFQLGVKPAKKRKKASTSQASIPQPYLSSMEPPSITPYTQKPTQAAAASVKPPQ